jgi:hypothetical protein
MEGSKFSLTSLSEMKTDDVKNSYCSETTRVHIGRKDYTNSIKINWSWYNLILYCQSLLIICRGKKLKKITMGSSLSIIHSSNGQMTSSDYRYCDRACLAATQSSNERRDVGVPLLLGVQNVAFESSCQNRDAHQCGNGYESLAHCYCDFEAPCPIIEASLRICHRQRL